jgi:hypothetical protein
VFRLSYLVPSADPSFASDVTEMLTIPDWRRKTNEILGITGASKKRDGQTDDGRSIYNLLFNRQGWILYCAKAD